ncbi:DUF6461 domain-containing protein [Planobispora takensis]|uniref:Uncharacterized protein n=1 Tax=Planobispora takensis TaxID=1367882 RepID=A0A8J3SWF0_9ACTN|nr:DUF6461 domain-containing protein [Planobispora takensis]GII00560.1 hypothetical protein Pta02_25680 [Planobispora takensis]
MKTLKEATLTISHEEFGWLLKHGPFRDVSCVSFVRSLTPSEALIRLGAEEDTIEEVTFDAHQERTMEYIYSDNFRSSYVGALEKDGWTILIQFWTGSLTTDEHLLRSLSRATEVVSVYRNVQASDCFSYTVDGELVTFFDQLAPYARRGSAPDRLLDTMREVGLDLGPSRETPIAHNPFPQCFALAKKITGISFTEDTVNTPLLGAAVRNR